MLIGLVSPFIVDKYSNNWEEEFKKKEIEIAQRVQTIISKNEEELLLNDGKIEKNIFESKPQSISDFLEVVILEQDINVCVNIFKSNQLVGWNKKQLVSAEEVEQLKLKWGVGNAFFYEASLMIYLANVVEVDSVKIFSAIPIQKKYFLKNTYYKNLSITDLIAEEFDASVSLVFDNNRLPPNSYGIKNSNELFIGSVKVNKISKQAETQKLENLLSLQQSIFAVFAFGFFLLWFSSKITFSNTIIKNIYFIVSLIALRIVFSLLSIGEYLGFSDLINPIYFSSIFVFGLTKSPIELFLTILTVLIISIKIFLSFSDNLNTNHLAKTTKILLGFIFLIALILLYNGFASTIKSIIFDSSILYFKDASLFASYQTTFMYLNILLIGLSGLLLSVIFVLMIVNIIDDFKKVNKYVLILSLFFLSALFILIDEVIYSKSSVLFSLFFLLFVFGVSFYWKYFKATKFAKIITLLLSSSILSISFLNFFNTELEINSLKTIANELTRSNIDLYEYYVDDAVAKIQKDKSLAQKIQTKNINLDAEAFLLWTKTALPTEVQGSVINIIDKNKNLIGRYEYRFDEEYFWNWDDTISSSRRGIKVNLFGDDSSSKIISVITPIQTDENIIGYVEILAIYDAYKIAIASNDKLISYVSPFKKLPINIDLLKIYEFRNDELSSYFTNIFLTQSEKEQIKNSTLSVGKDTWANIEINNERNIFYVRKQEDSKGEKIIAVGLSNKDITWNLFDFFKVFFIHSIMIMLVLLVLALINYKSWKNIQISFRAKILFALLVVSIIPLILLASYFKQITDEKNSNAINYKLGKRADNVEEYINAYISSSLLNTQAIFDKATSDLGINYSIYENQNLIYSSEGTYYRIELLPVILNPTAFLEINKYGMDEIILEESVENYSFNSLYHKYNIAGKEYVIKVSDLFNNYQLPMSGIELNVFLFGTYSLAIIVIIILSTLLANQISSPIEKLTKATRSVSHGDMDIQLPNIKSGEVKELIDGFNLMVRELKKNQIELAEVERESAWREMAKQVAHEIKNPLTPMKLAVQHLVAAHNDKSEKYNSIFEKVTSTIITQIDTLKNIASEFSSFAKMPSIKVEEVDVVAIINDTIDLFIEEDCVVESTSKEDKVLIKSDKEQFQRMIINLVRNSIQANGKAITISVENKDEKIELLVSDNGDGIEHDILPNIFDENFTTKKAGMGLGLALTRRFLNQTNGTISVEKTSADGTTIKIELIKDA